MKRWNSLFDTMRFPIKLLLLAFILIEIGSIITNRSVNIFYSLDNIYLKIISQLLINIGKAVIINFPLIVIVRVASRRAKSGTPILIGIIGYFTFLVFTMIFQHGISNPEAFMSIMGIEIAKEGISGGIEYRYPIQTGLLGALLVGYITRYSYVKSRRRSPYSIVAFLDKDTVGYFYNFIFCALAGFATTIIWPYFMDFIQNLVSIIAANISDPRRLMLYGVLDRTLSMLGLGNLIRQPFWFGSVGGSMSTIVGETILGDVGIFTKLESLNMSTLGYGRFITPYYVLNMFAIPAMILSFLRLDNRKSNRNRFLFAVIVLCILSIINGNPMPLELFLFFSAPFLFVVHIGLSALLFGILQYYDVYLGFSYVGDTTFASPGSFLDYIILLRQPEYQNTLMTILIIGLIFAVIYYLVTWIYVKFLAFDFLSSGKKEHYAISVIDAIGGVDNIESVYSSPFKLTVILDNQQLIVLEKLKKLNFSKIAETSEGIIIYSGMASTILRKEILKVIEISKRK